MTSAVDRRSPAGAGLAVAAWIVAVVAALLLLRETSELLIPIVVAVLISYALEPAVAWLARHRVPRIAGAGILLGLLVGSVAWGAYTLRDDAAAALEGLPRAAERARTLWTEGSAPARHVQKAADALSGSSGGTTAADTPGTSLAGWVGWGVESALALAGHLTVIVFLAFFLLVSGGHFKRRLIEVAGRDADDQRLTATIVDDIDAQIQRFLLVRAVTSVVVAVATWGALAWLGVAHAAVWGILAGVFNSIPYFGPIIVSGGLFAVGLAQGGDTAHALTIAAAALVITSLEGWLLTPPLMGKAERMHVVVVFLGVLLWTWIWGAWGTILAVPMLAIVKSVADHVHGLRPLGRLMAP